MSHNKLTIEEVREICLVRGITLLTTKYKDNRTKMPCLCSCGEKMWKRLTDIQQGQRCINCGYKYRKTRRLGLDIVKRTFQENGCELLSDYKGSKAPLIFKCSCGEVDEVTYERFRKGQRCTACYYKKISGPNNWNYNPEITDEDRERGRFTPELREWAAEVKRRDKYTCTICGDDSGGNLHSHHIFSYSKYIDKRYDLENGVTVCESCHIAFHKKYGYGNNDADQFIEFMADNCVTEVGI